MRARESVFVFHAAGRFTRLLALAILALTVATFFAWRAASADHDTPSDFNHWVYVGEAGHDSSEATVEDLLGIDTFPGCEGLVGIPFGTDPAWVRVGLSTDPSTRFVEARGQLLRTNPSNPDTANPKITWKDTTTNHWSMDINAYLTLDPGFRHLLSADEFSGTLDIEWERGGVPMYAWPSLGDRMTVWGTHIWDCGHGDAWFGGDDFYKTEIHSPVGWVVFRNSADADHTPDSEEKRTRDWVWYDTGDLQGSATTMLSQGTFNTPIHATVADAFFSSFGGNLPESVNGCDTDFGPVCTQSNEWRQSVLQQAYTFFVPAPPRPAGEPSMIWESEDRCAAVPTDPADPPNDDPEDVGDAGDDLFSSAHDIGVPTCSMSEDVSVGVENGHPGIWVTVNATPTTYPSNNYVAFAKRYKVGWDHIPPPHLSARQIRVDFNTLRVINDGEPCGEDGEWLLALGANEGWIYPVRGSGDGGDPFWEFGSVDDGLCCIGDCDPPYQDYGINAGVNIIATHDQPINFFAGGFETDLNPTTLANDIIPWIRESKALGGPHFSRLGSGADGPAYRVIYTISDISLPPPTPGTLTIGDPKYGPNADTGGTATRVSKLTPITLEDSDATQLEFRYWKEGTPKPTTWGLDADASDGLKFELTEASSDGRYTIEYAPVSDNGIVAVRRTASVELDSTAPALTVPDDMVLDATSAAGRIVNYTVTAEDNLPGPVTVECVPASGSFFQIKQVTTVNCSAEDAVGNESTDSFTVEVVSPFGYIPDFVLLSHQWTEISNNVRVQTGNVGAFNTSGGVPNSQGFEVVIGPGAVLTGGSTVAAQSVKLLSSTQAGRVYRVDQLQAGTGAIYTDRIGYVPLFLGMPVFPSFTAGGASRTYNNAVSLPAGSYGSLRVKSNGIVTLTGGNYYFTSIDIDSGGKLLASAGANIHVTGRVRIGSGSTLGPAAGGPTASDIVVWIAGVDGPPGQPTAFASGNGATLGMNVYARNGTTTVGEANVATGAFLGLRVRVGNGARLNLDSAFDFP